MPCDGQHQLNKSEGRTAPPMFPLSETRSSATPTRRRPLKEFYQPSRVNSNRTNSITKLSNQAERRSEREMKRGDVRNQTRGLHSPLSSVIAGPKIRHFLKSIKVNQSESKRIKLNQTDARGGGQTRNAEVRTRKSEASGFGVRTRRRDAGTPRFRVPPSEFRVPVPPKPCKNPRIQTNSNHFTRGMLPIAAFRAPRSAFHRPFFP